MTNLHPPRNGKCDVIQRSWQGRHVSHSDILKFYQSLRRPIKIRWWVSTKLFLRYVHILQEFIESKHGMERSKQKHVFHSDSYLKSSLNRDHLFFRFCEACQKATKQRHHWGSIREGQPHL